MPNHINCYVCGEGKVILFLHGWGQNKEMMMPLVEELKGKYKCVLLDMPGFGKSKFNGVKKFNEYICEIRRYLEEKKLLPDYIVGHSFGGKIAVGYQLKYKDLKKIVLIASPILKPKRTLKYYLKVAAYKIKKRLCKNIKEAGSQDYKNCKEEMKALFVDTVNTHYNKKVKKIDIPVLLLWGKDDQTVPVKKAKKLNKKIAKSELFILNGKHFAYLDNIEYTKLVIQRFIRGA